MLMASIREIHNLHDACWDGIADGIVALYGRRSLEEYESYHLLEEQAERESWEGSVNSLETIPTAPRWSYEPLPVSRLLACTRIEPAYRMWLLSSLADHCPELPILAARLMGRPTPGVNDRGRVDPPYNHASLDSPGSAWIGFLFDALNGCTDSRVRDVALGRRNQAFDRSLYRFALVADTAGYTKVWQGRRLSWYDTMHERGYVRGYYGEVSGVSA